MTATNPPNLDALAQDIHERLGGAFVEHEAMWCYQLDTLPKPGSTNERCFFDNPQDALLDAVAFLHRQATTSAAEIQRAVDAVEALDTDDYDIDVGSDNAWIMTYAKMETRVSEEGVLVEFLGIPLHATGDANELPTDDEGNPVMPLEEWLSKERRRVIDTLTTVFKHLHG